MADFFPSLHQSQPPHDVIHSNMADFLLLSTNHERFGHQNEAIAASRTGFTTDNRIKQDKKCFYQKQIEDASGDQRATWKGLECSSAPFQRGNIFG